MSELQERLLKVQMQLKAPKDLRNDFAKFNYRSCEAILTAVKPLLNEQGLTLKLYDEMVMLGDRFYIKAHAQLTYKDEVEIATAYAREELSLKGQIASQITGGTSSYARKYALNGLFLIDDTKDIDSLYNTKTDGDKKSTTKTGNGEEIDPNEISQTQIKLIKKLSLTNNLKAALTYYKVKEVSELTKIQATKIITRWNNPND
jgi:hypothetical protein